MADAEIETRTETEAAPELTPEEEAARDRVRERERREHPAMAMRPVRQGPECYRAAEAATISPAGTTSA